MKCAGESPESKTDGGTLRVIKEFNLLQLEKRNGVHEVLDKECTDNKEWACFSFDPLLKKDRIVCQCHRYRKVPTGTKGCME